MSTGSNDKQQKIAVEIATAIGGISRRLNTDNTRHLGESLCRYMAIGLPIQAQLAHAFMDNYRHTDDVAKTHYRVFMRAYQNGVFLLSLVLANVTPDMVELHKVIIKSYLLRNNMVRQHERYKKYILNPQITSYNDGVKV